MDSRILQLADDDSKAREWIRENLRVCAHSHSLSRKLLAYFLTTSGSMIAFVEQWVDPDQLPAYRYSLPQPVDITPYVGGLFSKDRLKVFVAEYLQSSANAMVICENSGSIRKQPEYWSWGTMPPISCYGDEEVYHVFTPAIANPDMIDAGVGDAMRHWGTGVCASCVEADAGPMLDESFLDAVVRSTEHVFMPVFDGDGILIWSHPQPNEGLRGH